MGMIDCLMELRNEEFVCTTCNWGKGKGLKEPVHRNCPMDRENIQQRIRKFRDRLLKMTREHRPDPENGYRTMDQIDELFSICKKCKEDRFRGDTCTVFGGCDGQIAYIVHLTRKRKKCPQGLWDKLLDERPDLTAESMPPPRPQERTSD